MQEHHSLCWDVVLSLNAMGRGLALPQLNGPGLLTPHGSSYPLGAVGREWVGWETRGVEGGAKGGIRGKTMDEI